MKLKKAIELAQYVAKEDYDTIMKEIGAHDPKYKRKWEKHPKHNIWGLSGTPDKAFVMVSKDKKNVIALNQAQEKIAVFYVAG